VIPPHGGRLSVDLALDHQAALLRADRAWLAALLQRWRPSATELAGGARLANATSRMH